MFLKYFVLLVQIAGLANGDPLKEFAEKKLEGLSSWLEENIADELFVSDTNFTSSCNSWIEYNLKSVNYIVKGLSGIQLRLKPATYGDLYEGSCGVALAVIVNITLTGSYQMDGFLFPFIERVPFSNFGLWDVSLMATSFSTGYRANISISMNSSIFLEFDPSNYSDNTIWPDFQIHNFLPDHANEWYYQIMKESFENGFKSDIRSKIYYHLDQLKPFFNEHFKDITYFDIVGSL